MSFLSNSYKRRWIAWLLLTVPYILTIIYRNSSAVLSEEFTRVFHTTGTELGLLHAGFFWVYALGQLPAGVLADRLGSRKTAMLGSTVMSLGGIAFFLSISFEMALLSRIVIGAGGSVLYIAVLRFCANWFRPDEFATVSGLTLSGSALGGILATTPLAVAIVTFGWRSTILFLSVAGFVVTAGIYVLVYDRPEDAGLEPIGSVPEPESSTSMREVLENTKLVLSDYQTWLIGVMMFCFTGVGTTVVGLWGVPYIVQLYGISVTYASTFLLMNSIGMLLGAGLVGWISDRFERRTGLIVLGGFGYLVGYGSIALLVTPPMPVLLLAFLLPGFAFGGVGLTYTVVKERNPATASGVATGTINGMGFLGAAIFPSIMGWILDSYWTGETVDGARVYTETGYQMGFGLISLVIAIATACAFVLHRRTETGVSQAARPDAEVTPAADGGEDD